MDVQGKVTDQAAFLPFNLFLLDEEIEHSLNVPCTSDIHFYCLSEEAGRVVVKRAQSSETVAGAQLAYVSTTAIGAIAFSADAAKRLGKLLEQSLSSHLDSETLSVKVFTLKDKSWASEFSKWLQVRLIRALRSASRDVVALQRSLFSMRKEHERIQEAFSALENFYNRNPEYSDVIKFTAESAGQFLAPTKSLQGNSPFKLEQLLPVRSVGLSAIDLFFKRPDVVSEGNVLVDLRALEDNRELGTWDVTYEQLNEGWNTFALEKSDIGFPKGVVLTITFETKRHSGTVPSIALSFTNPLSEYRVSVDGKNTSLSSLAFRCREYMPGLRIPRTTHAFLSKERINTQEVGPILLGSQHLNLVKEVGRSAAKGAPKLVQALDDGQRILVHPRPEGISAGYIDGVCPANIERITAQVFTDNPSAAEILYALAVVPKKFPVTREVSEELILSVGGNISGWHAVPPMQKHCVNLMINPTALTKGSSLLLMTKVDKGTSVENAWATFAQVEFFEAMVEKEMAE
jgi:hypothetical protein